MFVDASVIVAILGRESDGEVFAERLRGADVGKIYVSPLVRYEAAVALARIKAREGAGIAKPNSLTVSEAARAVDALLEWLDAGMVDVTAEIGEGAVQASAIYGKLVGHPAALNFGDCFAYACARSLGVPLLYKGDDFSRTDLA